MTEVSAYLRIRNHDRSVGPGDVEVALEELPEAAPVHGRLVAAVHLPEVVPAR